jgi:hypothetical protein
VALAKQWTGRDDDFDPYSIAVHEAGYAVMTPLVGRLDDVECVKIMGSGGKMERELGLKSVAEYTAERLGCGTMVHEHFPTTRWCASSSSQSPKAGGWSA